MLLIAIQIDVFNKIGQVLGFELLIIGNASVLQRRWYIFWVGHSVRANWNTAFSNGFLNSKALKVVQ